jgi:hypothetical protein
MDGYLLASTTNHDKLDKMQVDLKVCQQKKRKDRSFWEKLGSPNPILLCFSANFAASGGLNLITYLVTETIT